MVIETSQPIDSSLVPRFTHDRLLNASIGYATADTILVPRIVTAIAPPAMQTRRVASQGVDLSVWLRSRGDSLWTAFVSLRAVLRHPWLRQYHAGIHALVRSATAPVALENDSRRDH